MTTNQRIIRTLDLAGDDTERAEFIECDPTVIAAQISRWTLAAISGGRVQARRTGITLPISRGWAVTIDLAADDTYTVRRLRARNAVFADLIGEQTGVYAQDLSETAYVASCYVNRGFGDDTDPLDNWAARTGDLDETGDDA